MTVMPGHLSYSAIDSGLPHSPGGALHVPQPISMMTTGDMGILKSNLLPSLGLYSGLSLATYIAAQRTDPIELKEWLEPSVHVINAWWTAIGGPMCATKMSFLDTWTGLPWTEKLILTCVTAWGCRQIVHLTMRSFVRGKNAARCDNYNQESEIWDRWKYAFFKVVLPEAALRTVISLIPTTPSVKWISTLTLRVNTLSTIRAGRVLGAAILAAGFGLEAITDPQLELQDQEHPDEQLEIPEERFDHIRQTVSRIVRLLNDLGGTLVHLSFPIFHITECFNPFAFVGPFTSLSFLHYVDKQTEASQEERDEAEDAQGHKQSREELPTERNGFWSSLRDSFNPFHDTHCSVIVVAGGIAAVLFAEDRMRIHNLL